MKKVNLAALTLFIFLSGPSLASNVDYNVDVDILVHTWMGAVKLPLSEIAENSIGACTGMEKEALQFDFTNLALTKEDKEFAEKAKRDFRKITCQTTYEIRSNIQYARSDANIQQMNAFEGGATGKKVAQQILDTVKFGSAKMNRDLKVVIADLRKVAHSDRQNRILDMLESTVFYSAELTKEIVKKVGHMVATEDIQLKAKESNSGQR